jgi:protein tyrosine phosphatase (PTP) superfamily phosphohydrolase (DUF442 family)
MTSGLPAAEDFALMAEQGYEVVISLAESSDSVALDNEDALVSDARMRFVHMPIDFEAPALDDYVLLSDILRTLYPRKVWLHCTKNHRVSSMMCIYNVVERSMLQNDAEEIMRSIWQPDETWHAYIDEALEKYAYQYI